MYQHVCTCTYHVHTAMYHFPNPVQVGRIPDECSNLTWMDSENVPVGCALERWKVGVFRVSVPTSEDLNLKSTSIKLENLAWVAASFWFQPHFSAWRVSGGLQLESRSESMGSSGIARIIFHDRLWERIWILESPEIGNFMFIPGTCQAYTHVVYIYLAYTRCIHGILYTWTGSGKIVHTSTYQYILVHVSTGFTYQYILVRTSTYCE